MLAGSCRCFSTAASHTDAVIHEVEVLWALQLVLSEALAVFRLRLFWHLSLFLHPSLLCCPSVASRPSCIFHFLSVPWLLLSVSILFSSLLFSESPDVSPISTLMRGSRLQAQISLKWCVSCVCFVKSSYRSAYVCHEVAETFVKPAATIPGKTNVLMLE